MREVRNIAAGALDRASGLATLYADSINKAGTDWGDFGVLWMALHELVHYTPAGTTVDLGLQASWLATHNNSFTGWVGSGSFAENEEFANLGTRAILTLMGVEFPDGYVPKWGYEYGDPNN